ncbi:Hydroxypyruvate reductase [Pseudomonas fluorescens]|uniref:hydroxyacid dehydrogenase n=1 Tax=Pseudomonas fluorescens TaxID=294 RepID=UPI00123FE76E|nr:hydroxyacid dehydrogenase [Pseudomonas fluorescens]VVM81510.1 Hydroxypyruvate reductase [Pseudomonas fluorescens]
MPLIYVTSPIHPRVLAGLADLGEVRLGYGANAVSYDEIHNQVDAVFLRGGHVSPEMIAASPKLRIVARHGAGYDNVDYQAAAQHGVWVTNTPGANQRSVIEHVFALLLSLCRKLPMASEQTRNRNWAQDRLALTGIELEGRTLGLVGFGNIGASVAPVAEAFGLKVIFTDPAIAPGTDPRWVDLDTLLATADVISLHVPLLPTTRNLIGAKQFARMKDGALLINTSRGGVVDEQAMVAALNSGKLAGAGVDVLDAENLDMINPFNHPTPAIAETPNLIVTAHVAGQTDESLMRVGMSALQAIAAVLQGQAPAHPVNQPVPKSFD